MSIKVLLICSTIFSVLNAGTLKGHVKYDEKAPKKKEAKK